MENDLISENIFHSHKSSGSFISTNTKSGTQFINVLESAGANTLVARTVAGRMTTQGVETESELSYYFIFLWAHFSRAPLKVKQIQLV